MINNTNVCFSNETFSSKVNLQWDSCIRECFEWHHFFWHTKSDTALHFCAMANLHLFRVFHQWFGKCGFWIAISNLVSVACLVWALIRRHIGSYLLFHHLKVPIWLEESDCVSDCQCRAMHDGFAYSDHCFMRYSTCDWHLFVHNGNVQMH